MKRLLAVAFLSMAMISFFCPAQAEEKFPYLVKPGEMKDFETEKGFLIVFSFYKKNNFRCGRFVSMQEGLEIYSGDILKKRESQKVIFLEEDFFLSCQDSNVLVSKQAPK
ncbi:MAG: hypothetical protein V3574_03195 [Candidatus Moraniibacteriota bacterium]